MLNSSWGRWLPVIGYAALIYMLSDQPKLPSTPGGDKTAHLVAYAGLGFLLARAMGPGVRAGFRWLGAFVGGTLYGLSDEWHQSFVPGRHASVDDFVADAAGAAIGGLLFLGVRRAATQLYPDRCADEVGMPNSSAEAAAQPPKEAP